MTTIPTDGSQIIAENKKLKELLMEVRNDIIATPSLHNPESLRIVQKINEGIPEIKQARGMEG